MFSLKEVKLADLPAGALVTLKLSTDLKEAQNIIAEGPAVQGTVKAVDAGKRTITLTQPASRRGERTKRVKSTGRLFQTKRPFADKPSSPSRGIAAASTSATAKASPEVSLR